MKKVNLSTETFDIGGGFFVDVQEELERQNGKPVYGFWLCHQQYGVKTMMIGLPMEKLEYQKYGSLDELIPDLEIYIQGYREEVMDEE